MEKVILFCPAFGSKIGTGHLKRCLVLAYHFRAFGCEPIFFGEFDNIPFRTTREPDSGQVLTVIDDYSKDASFHKQFQSKIMVLDDLANRDLYCDFLLDQNYRIKSHEGLYRHVLQKEATCFFGIEYCLLDKGFQDVKCQLGRDYLFIFVTGGDCQKSTITAIKGAVLTGKTNIKCVIGGLNPHCREIETLCRKHDIELFIDTDKMPQLMARAEVCIGSFGTNTWERLALAKPTVGMILADNQEEVAIACHQNGLATNLGWHFNVNEHKIRDAVFAQLQTDEIEHTGKQVASKTAEMVRRIVLGFV